MEGKDFLHLLNHADCLIGNSSVGIRECAYLGVPVVNIGSRQNRRDRGENVVDTVYEVENIKNAVAERVQNETKFVSDVYGGGDAGKQIADLLDSLPLQFHKTIMY
jgi:UDP-N-acetylglucosamine 2-epimerase